MNPPASGTRHGFVNLTIGARAMLATRRGGSRLERGQAATGPADSFAKHPLRVLDPHFVGDAGAR